MHGVAISKAATILVRIIRGELHPTMALECPPLLTPLQTQVTTRDTPMKRIIDLVHRLGRLEIGESSVLIAVYAGHRAAAFDACRWLIDTLKRTVPIWKKEYFADGAVWADGEPFPPEINKLSS